MAFKFISEVFFRSSVSFANEFIEIRIDADTDVSNFYIALYDNGSHFKTVSLSDLTAHDNDDGDDTYIVFWDSTAAVNFGGQDSFGVYTSSDGGVTADTVHEFVSPNNSATAPDGPLAGETMTRIGTTGANQSRVTTDGINYANATPSPIAPAPACFLSGTLIATQNGEVAIEDLTAGDQIALQGGGFATLRWVGYSDADASGENHASTAPICIPAHAFGADMPKRDLYVSPNHRIWLQHGMLELHFATNEVLVAAKHLVGWRGITQATDVPSPRYFHMLFDQHEIVISDGLPTESFHPAAIVTTGFDRETREELLALFPEMDHMALQNTTAASLCLKAYEVPVAMHAIAA